MCFCGNCGSVLQLGWHGDTYREFRCKIGQLLRTCLLLGVLSPRGLSYIYRLGNVRAMVTCLGDF